MIRFSLIVVLLLVNSLAQAQEARSYEGFLRPDEILQCLRDHREVSAENQTLSAEKARLAQEAAGIALVEEGLVKQQDDIAYRRKRMAEQREILLRGEPNLENHLRATQSFNKARDEFEQVVKVYNEGVRAQQARRDPHNAAVLALNARLDRLRQRQTEVDGRCTGKQSYKDDLARARQALAEEQAVR